MPYIVTTTRAERHASKVMTSGTETQNVVSRQAVATLEKVADQLTDVHGYSVTTDDLREEFHHAAQSPMFALPDGTVIVAEHKTWANVMDAAGGGWPQIPGVASDPLAAEIIDAYNAVQQRAGAKP